MKILIVYQSKQGFTKQYAEWIRDSLDCDILENKLIRTGMIAGYDMVICGSGIYAGNIEGFDVVKMCSEKTDATHIIGFVVGLANPEILETHEVVEKAVNKVLGTEISKKVKYFYMQGGVRYGKLNPIYKSMVKMMGKTMTKNNFRLRKEDIALINAKKQDSDFSDRSNIAPLLKYINELGEK